MEKSKKVVKKSEVRPVVKPKVQIKNCGGSISRKVIPNRVMSNKDVAARLSLSPYDIEDMLEEIYQFVMDGNDVLLTSNIGGGVRFYGCANTDLNKLVLCAKTEGSYRDSISAVDFDMVHIDHGRHETKLDRDSACRFRRDTIERSKECVVKRVTPDLMVTCPECGANFRVGKKLD